MVDAPLTAAKLAKSANFNLEEEDGDIYSDTEMDMPGYEPPRSFEDEPIPTSAAPVDEEQLEKDQKAKENLLQTQKILVDTAKSLGLDLCKKYKESKVEFMISQITAGQTDCPICKKKLKKTSRLKEHMNQHLVDPKFVCPECNKGFGERQGYNRHLLAHKPHNKYKCDYCTMYFDIVGHKNQHQLKHTKTYKCKHCERICGTLKGQRHHEYKCEKQPGGKPAKTKCPYCPKEYVDKKQTNRHIISKYPGKPRLGQAVKV